MAQTGNPQKGLLMEIEGNRRAILSGCRGIVTYTESQIRMRTDGGAVSLYGSGLEMGCMTVDGATVCGRLQRIEFEEGE